MFKKPNFFIVGAPKSGTTSLAAWLSEHPQVFMPNRKELDFFDYDRQKGYKDDLARYELFFSDTAEHHLAIGEASTGYLRSRVAVSEILRYSPGARFVVGLRNPIDMAISWHGQVIFEAWESEHDFARAWKLQDARRVGKQVPRLCPDSKNLLYGEVCKIGRQMVRLFTQVPRDRVFVYTLDEMRDDSHLLWMGLHDFLCIQDDHRSVFPSLNEAKNVPGPLRVVTRLVADLKRNLGISRYGFGLINNLNRLAARKRTVDVGESMQFELAEYYHDDILLLSDLIGRDLSHWLKTAPQSTG